MTDEEIERALKDLTSIDLSDESNYDSCGRIIPPRGMSVIYEALDYINRLKAENEDLYFQNQNLQTYIDNHEKIWKCNAEIGKAQVHKDTALRWTMSNKEIQTRAKFSFSTANKKGCKWLAKIKANCTLWFDEYADTFDWDKPYEDAEVKIRRNTVLFIYEEYGVIDNCKYVGRLANGALKIGWQTLKSAIGDSCFDILEFTKKCKAQYLSEVCE